MIYEAKIKDLEIERLNRNIKGLKNERAMKLKKELETYEKMLQKIKKKVSIITISQPPKFMHGQSNSMLKEGLVAELHLVEQYKDDIIQKSQQDLLESEDSEEDRNQSAASTQTELSTCDQQTYIGYLYSTQITQTDSQFHFYKNLNINSIGTNTSVDELKSIKDLSDDKPLKTKHNDSEPDNEHEIERQNENIGEQNEITMKAEVTEKLLVENKITDEIIGIEKSESKKAVDEELLDLKRRGMIPDDIDIESWGAGYYTGLERGKSLISKEAVEIEENLIMHAEYETDESLESECNSPKLLIVAERKIEDIGRFSPREATQEKKVDETKKKKNNTKIMEFNFKKREKLFHQKILKSKRIRDIILKKSIENIKRKAKMSKKMILKMVNGIYTTLISKYKQDDFIDDLLEFIYQEFQARYSMKKIVDRKIIEFICNLLKYSDLLQIRNFIKFLDLSEKISDKALQNRKEEFLLYLSGLDSILKSKAGVMPLFDEISEIHYIPLIRSIEFFKDKFSDIFPPAKVSKSIEFLEKNSTYDKRRLNKLGVIELEFVLNFALSQFEENLLNTQQSREIIQT